EFGDLRLALAEVAEVVGGHGQDDDDLEVVVSVAPDAFDATGGPGGHMLDRWARECGRAGTGRRGTLKKSCSMERASSILAVRATRDSGPTQRAERDGLARSA